MKHYTKPAIEITKIDTGEGIMRVSYANINTTKIKHDSTGTNVGQLDSWN
jgi:hypothetical protein